MKKILFVANIHKHFIAFHLPYIQWLKEQGYEVHVAANGKDVTVPYVDKQFNLCIERSPFRFANIKAYRALKKIIDAEQYTLIHCHTAMGAVIARLAAKESRDKGIAKVLYTAHGFHFFRGAPLKYWVLFYPMEKYLSRYTDGIITINQEDFELVQHKHFSNKATYKINGIGLNTDRLLQPGSMSKDVLRVEYGYSQEKLILIYIAEYIHRKNHRFIVDAIPSLIKEIPQLKVLFVGRGLLMDQTKAYAKQLHVETYIDFMGFRSDVGKLIALSDVGISASRQEGLGLNLAEEMFGGLPVVATVDRGHKEMVEQGKNGYLFYQGNLNQFSAYIIKLANEDVLREQMGTNAFESVQKFTLPKVKQEMVAIYQRYL